MLHIVENPTWKMGGKPVIVGEFVSQWLPAGISGLAG